MPQGDAELMTKEQVLGFQPAARLKQIDNEHREQVQDCKHRPQSCDDSTLRRESEPDGIFGKDNVERMHLPDPTPDNHIETRFDADGGGTLMIMRMTLPDAAARAAMLATGMEQGMEASYVRLESMN